MPQKNDFLLSPTNHRFMLPKAATGIDGLDQITGGGFPRNRSTLICGGPGCGKTLLSLEFLIHGVERYGENGVFVAFEESTEDLITNSKSLGKDLERYIQENRLILEPIQIERNEIEETGEYDLEGLIARLSYAIDHVQAKRVVIDTMDSLFSGFENKRIVRGELRRILSWLKQKGVTTVITSELGEGRMTRSGIEEYVTECVILLDHRVQNQIATRRLRVLKYRGTRHSPDEFPFVIDDRGLSVLPVSSLHLDYPASNERITTGIAGLDEMLGGLGFYRGSSILVSGAAGTGKSSISATMAHAACQRGERCIYFAFEESPQQIVRNMKSIGLHLDEWVRKGLLQFHAVRPTLNGIETHLVKMYQQVEFFQPSLVVIDPLSSLMTIGTTQEVKSLFTRLADHLKMNGITAFFTCLIYHAIEDENTDIGISSLMDHWLVVRSLESNGTKDRGLYILKSRGMAHSSQIREFKMSDQGIELVDVYVGPNGILTGSSRIAQEAKDRIELLRKSQKLEMTKMELMRKKSVLEYQIKALQEEFTAEEEKLKWLIQQNQEVEEEFKSGIKSIAHPDSVG